MNISQENYSSPYFKQLDLSSIYNQNISNLDLIHCSKEALEKKVYFPTGEKIFRGIPFRLGKEGKQKNNILILRDSEFVFKLPEVSYVKNIIFLHAADNKNFVSDDDGIFRPMKGSAFLGEIVAEYTVRYSDGTTHSIPIKRRFNIGLLNNREVEFCFEAHTNGKPNVFRTTTETIRSKKIPEIEWGWSQHRTSCPERDFPVNRGVNIWLYSFENPKPEKGITELIFKGTEDTVFILGISLSDLEINPLLWEQRKKAVLELPLTEEIKPDEIFDRIQIDLGTVISCLPVIEYNNKAWCCNNNEVQPKEQAGKYIIEYTSHPAGIMHVDINEGFEIPLANIKEIYSDTEPNNPKPSSAAAVYFLPPATKTVKLKITEKNSKKPVPVKLHIHGTAGEYLPPVNRHRIPNPFWFEDYSTDLVKGKHFCTYINGSAELKLPFGPVYFEITKGFEIAPVKKKYDINESTDTIEIELESVLSWRERGWITADTHVHFLSPKTALLEGEAEGVNVVNLLASQWGEFFSNIGDFDGKTTYGSRDNGGEGEYIVRVGTENRQHILGHISLLGYEGDMILPLTTGGPDESALGDPVGELISGWAEQVRKQKGIAILPHFPHPRLEGAAAIVLNRIDGVEIVATNRIFPEGLSTYSLSDWYRYLNCGYHIPAVGGTDKMSAERAVGEVRTYANIENDIFTYEKWMEAVKKGRTFVTCGGLVDFHVNGARSGGTIDLAKTGGTLDIEWEAASLEIPLTKVELIVTGETKEVKSIDSILGSIKGSFSLKMNESGWVAIRVRGKQTEKREIIIVHSSAVMIYLEGKKCFNHPDALTILDQIEGAMAYVRTIGTRAEEIKFKKMMMTLTSAHRSLHNRMHQNRIYHNHTVVEDHHTN